MSEVGAHDRVPQAADPAHGAGSQQSGAGSQQSGAGESCAAAADGAPGLPVAAIAGACTDDIELAGLSDAESRLLLVAHTARFTASFLRWIDARSCDGMNYSRLMLLQALHCGGPAIMRDLGNQLGVTPRNMTAMVDAMEDAHLVARRPHPTDRRATLIELSPEGAREAAQELEPRLSAMAEIFAGLTPAEREQFAAATSKLMQAMADRQQSC